MDGCHRIDGERCGLRGMTQIELTYPSIFAGRREGGRPSMPRGWSSESTEPNEEW
jgi:hypothetical protein